MPERQDLDAFPGNCYSIVDVVVDALEVNSSNAGQGRVGGTGADFGLRGDEHRSTFQLLPDRVGCFEPVESPPTFGLQDLLSRKLAELDYELASHSRPRSEPRTSPSGTVWPRSHSAIDWSSMRSISGSASKVWSPSGRRTVTRVPSGKSDPSSSTRPPTTRPDATRMMIILAWIGVHGSPFLVRCRALPRFARGGEQL